MRKLLSIKINFKRYPVCTLTLWKIWGHNTMGYQCIFYFFSMTGDSLMLLHGMVCYLRTCSTQGTETSVIKTLREMFTCGNLRRQKRWCNKFNTNYIIYKSPPYPNLWLAFSFGKTVFSVFHYPSIFTAMLR